MPACPVCRDDFEDDVRVCPTDGVELVDRSLLPPPPVEQAQLGLFHPAVVGLVEQFLATRSLPVRRIDVDDQRVELWVGEDVRDDVRAALTVNWSTFVGRVDPVDRMEIAAIDGDHPGWHDPPRGAWVDDDGRLRVDPSPDEAAEEDASRTLGPALSVAGVVILLLAWVTGFDAGPVLLGVSALLLGLLIPR